MARRAPLIDGLQFCRYRREIFAQMRRGRVDAAHVTIAYHENCRETLANIAAWNLRLKGNADLLRHADSAAGIRRAMAEDKTAILFGFQNCSPLDDDLGMVQIFRDLGVCFMQLTYNNQSALAAGCYEKRDAGVTRFGREVIREMNRAGMVVDMSHSAERSTLDAIEISRRPIAVTHANPEFFHRAPRNKSGTVLKELAQSGGVLGLSLYPHHLKDGSKCTLESFCAMAERTVEIMGEKHVAIGSDLCQGHGDEVVAWMRDGKWRRKSEGEGEAEARWPPPLAWFAGNQDFGNITAGLRRRGFTEAQAAAVMGGNWMDFLEHSLAPGG